MMMLSMSAGRLCIVVALAISAIAVNITEGTELEVRNGSQTGMVWTGSIFPGQEPITLYGDVDELYSQILGWNPIYATESTRVTEARLAMNHVEGATKPAPQIDTYYPKRDIETDVHIRAPQMSCHSQMALGLRSRALGDAIRLKSLGGACGVPRGECRRMTCTEDTASYICSEADVDISITCKQAGDLLEELVNSCACKDVYFTGHVYKSASSTPYSIWGGYGHCRKSGNERPTNNPYPGGHGNGYC